MPSSWLAATTRTPLKARLTGLGDAGTVGEGGGGCTLAVVAQSAPVLLAATLAARVAPTLAGCVHA